MRDILIIFTVLLLLLITISTLGGSLTFVNKTGGTEYFTDPVKVDTKTQPLKQPLTQPKTATLSDEAAARAAVASSAAKPKVSFTQPKNTSATATSAGKPTQQVVEGFEGPIYATA